MVSYDDWINARILTDPAISRSTTHVVYRRVNTETAIPAQAASIPARQGGQSTAKMARIAKH
jgi:hypothetical protein